MVIASGTLRARAQWLVNSLSRTDISAREIIRRLRSEGMGYRDSDIFRDVRHYRGLERRQPAVKSVRMDRTFSDKLISQTDLNIRRRYRFTFDVVYRDVDTGELKEGKFSLSTSHLRTRAELEEEMARKLQEEEGETNLELVSVSIAEIEQRRGTGRSVAAPGAPWD